ncbi:MAG TPA: TOMM precursor leader peptide-binding protein [Isosphaeraceae bacterium]|nr:TOMM precursor leader peptide-binding protein [Isosphaeraceae bacterium]
MTENNTTTSSDSRLRAVPVQPIEISDGVLLVRGNMAVKLSGEGAAEAAQIVLTAAAGEGATPQELINLFGALDRPGAEQLVKILVARRLLVPCDSFPVPSANGETAQEVFYWEFGERADQVAARLGTRRIAVLGVNCISRQLVRTLPDCGFERVAVVDYPLLRNLRLFPGDTLAAEGWTGRVPVSFEQWEQQLDEGLDCVVATADFSGQQLLRHWNSWCVNRGCTFLPVMLDKGIGCVGPLVVPGETACYECLRARENSNLEDPETRRAAENLVAVVRRSDLNGFLPPMASILGDIAAMELTKFYGGVLTARVGTLLEVNLLRPELRARKVLKVPRCSVCSPLTRQSTISLERFSFLPGEPLDQPMNR